MSRATQILEYVAAAGGPEFRVDRAKGVIHGCKILGPTSDNGRDYPDGCRARAPSLYEGRGSFVDHADRPGQSRSAYDKVGWFENVRNTPAGIYGDFNVIKSHKMAPVIFEVAERRPDQLGFSHDADGRTRRGKDGREVVESLERVRSVDLVTDPATVKGLHESRRQPMSAAAAGKKTRRQTLAERVLGPKLKRWLLEWDGSGMDAPADEPPQGAMGPGEPMPDEAVADAEVCGQISDMAQGALDQADEKIHNPKYLKFLQKIVDACKAFDGGKEGGDEPPADEPTPTEEGRKLKADNARLLREAAVRSLCDAASFVPTAVQLKALAPLDDAEAGALIESFQGPGGSAQPPAPAGQRPRSQSPGFRPEPRPGNGAQRVTESRGGQPLKFEGEKASEQRLAYLRNGG